MVLLELVPAAGFRNEEEKVGLEFAWEDCGRFGAANFVRSLLTFVWLGCFESVGFREDDEELLTFLFEISRAAIWRVTEPMEVMESGNKRVLGRILENQVSKQSQVSQR